MFGGQVIIVKKVLRILVTIVMIVGDIRQRHDGGVDGNILVHHKHTVGIRSSIGKVVTLSAGRNIALILISIILRLLLKPLHKISLDFLVSTKVWCENVLLAIDRPDCLVIEHGVERVPRVTVLLKNSVPEFAPLVYKHVTGWTEILLKAVAIQTQQHVLGDLEYRKSKYNNKYQCRLHECTQPPPHNLRVGKYEDCLRTNCWGCPP